MKTIDLLVETARVFFLVAVTPKTRVHDLDARDELAWMLTLVSMDIQLSIDAPDDLAAADISLHELAAALEALPRVEDPVYAARKVRMLHESLFRVLGREDGQQN